MSALFFLRCVKKRETVHKAPAAMATEVSWKTVALFQRRPKLVHFKDLSNLKNSKPKPHTNHQRLENKKMIIVQQISTKVT